jgi:hypothetical protein
LRRAIFWTILSVLVAFAGFSLLKKHVQRTPSGELNVRSDVLVYVQASADLLAGRDMYHTDKVDPYIYPPFYAFANIPLLLVHPLLLDILWYILNVVLIGAIIYQCWFLFTGASFRSAPRKEQWVCAGLSVLFSLRYLVRNAQQGNVNVVLLFLVVFGFYMIRRTGRAYWAGLPGLAAAIKFLPLVAFLYFIAKRQWRCLGYGLLALLVATFLPSVLIGFEKNWIFLQSFFSVLGARFSPDGVAVENFAVWGTVGRLLSHQPAFLIAPGEPVYLNLVNLTLPSLRILVYGVNALLLLFCYNAARMEGSGNAQSSALPKEGSIVLVLLAMHLVSILIEDHHAVTYLVAYLYALIAWRRRAVTTRWFGLLLFASGILSIVLNHDIVVPIAGKTTYMILLSYSLPTLPVGIILFALALQTMRAHRKRVPLKSG